MFEWDDNKAASNQKKHKVSFFDAISIWQDVNALEIYDDDHSDSLEERWIRIGVSRSLNILVVVFCELSDEGVIEIISARKACSSEKDDYYKQSKR